MQVGETEQDGAAVPSRTDQEDTEGSPVLAWIGNCVCDFYGATPWFGICPPRMTSYISCAGGGALLGEAAGLRLINPVAEARERHSPSPHGFIESRIPVAEAGMRADSPVTTMRESKTR